TAHARPVGRTMPRQCRVARYNKNKIKNGEDLHRTTAKNLKTSPKITKRFGKSTNVSDADRAAAKNRQTTVKRPGTPEKIKKHETSGSRREKNSKDLNDPLRVTKKI